MNRRLRRFTPRQVDTLIAILIVLTIAGFSWWILSEFTNLMERY